MIQQKKRTHTRNHTERISLNVITHQRDKIQLIKKQEESVFRYCLWFGSIQFNCKATHTQPVLKIRRTFQNSKVPSVFFSSISTVHNINCDETNKFVFVLKLMQSTVSNSLFTYTIDSMVLTANLKF